MGAVILLTIFAVVALLIFLVLLFDGFEPGVLAAFFCGAVFCFCVVALTEIILRAA